MLERKFPTDKVRKHSSGVKTNHPTKFHKLFQNVDITLPTQLQHFLSEGLRFSDHEIARNISNKIRVVLKINECQDTPSCLTVHRNQNCVEVIDPTPSRRSQTSNTNVNLFPFDSILTDTDSPNFQFTDALIDPILNFIKGKDSCIFSFGHSGLGKTKSMIGFDQSIYNIGIIPCALAWIFKIIDFMKSKTTLMRYAIRISAIEVSGKNKIHDLLNNQNAVPKHYTDQKCFGTSLQENSNAMLSNQKELPANNLLEAAHILDAILSTRSNDNESLTHLQLIIHLYQYRTDSAEFSSESNNNDVKGEHSRLCLLDLGSGRHGNEDQNILSLQGMSKVILALYTSQRYIHCKENVLTQLLKDTLNPNISTTMLLHISSKQQNYSETLQVVQLAYKLYRMRLKKYRSVGFSVSDEASSCSSSSSGFQSRRLRPHMGIGAARRSSGNSSASSEFDLTSASELSCCETVIFKGDISDNAADKSPDRLSGKRKLRSISSESDNAFSDKGSSKSFSFSSGNIVSPSILRRRRTSPRTNARAWPSSTDSSNMCNDNAPELWVDGPNAVYKVENKEKQFENYETKKITSIETVIELPPELIPKPVMISKETQCDDVWDSGSSITDGSSHSNTLDRKDHRPLSDISECTEETESNLAIESDLIKMNIMDQLGQTDVLDDLLESTFGLSPMHQGNQFKSLGSAFLNPQNMSEMQFMDNVGKPMEIAHIDTSNEILINSEDDRTTIEPVIEHQPIRKKLNDAKKQYHSANDSKHSTKSENRERKSKTRCKKCSKKADDNRSKSMTSSNSTDFSRVASWIENVEYEIQSSNINNKSEIVNNQINSPEYDLSLRLHHHSQPDISYQQDFFSANMSQFNPTACQYIIPPNTQWMQNEVHQAQYSLYDGYKMNIANNPSISNLSLSRRNTLFLPVTPAVTQILPAQHMVTQQDVVLARQSHHSPKSKKVPTRLSNISLPTNRVPVNQLPLPPLPNPSLYTDTHVPINENLTITCSYNNPAPVSVPSKPKCKTLPRDMYSDSASIVKRNKNDIPSSKAVHAILAINELKSKDKSKKDPKKIMSILFAPFISLRNKIHKNKTNTDTILHNNDTDNEKSLDKRSDNCSQQISGWSPIENKLESSLVLSSPYHLMTQPKTSILPTESSGNGSDSSSLHKTSVMISKTNESSRRHKTRSGSVTHNSKHLPRQRPTSSGYGSIIIKGDSEVSSHNDSSSEYSLSGLNNNKVIGCHNRMKHSISLSNYKSISDANSAKVSKPISPEISSPICPITQHPMFNENVKIAEDLIVQEKLKMSLKEERKIVIQLIETNRLRGVPVDASVMNLICFKCVDNFDVNSPAKRNECEQLIGKIDQEIEQLKQKLIRAQHLLFLITSFDTNLQSQ